MGQWQVGRSWRGTHPVHSLAFRAFPPIRVLGRILDVPVVRCLVRVTSYIHERAQALDHVRNVDKDYSSVCRWSSNPAGKGKEDVIMGDVHPANGQLPASTPPDCSGDAVQRHNDGPHRLLLVERVGVRVDGG